MYLTELVTPSTLGLAEKDGGIRQTSENSKVEKVQRREEFFQAPAVAAR